MQAYWTSSLEKIFPDPTCSAVESNRGSALRNEVFSLQLAYRSEFLLNPLEIEVISPLAAHCEVRQVVPMSADFFGEEDDGGSLRRTPGLYPDLLASPQRFRSAPDIWHALWATVRIPQDCDPGKYALQLRLNHRNLYRKERCFAWNSPIFELEVLPVRLPKPRFKVAEWFYGDCLYDVYGLEPWSEEFFRVLKHYFLNMTRHGINVIFTPLMTPALDTEIGRERPTFQSVDVFRKADRSWRFGFGKLERYLELALECGFQYFEFGQLFTQWGAEFAPKVIVQESATGKSESCFGWKCRSEDPSYRDFLNAMLPELRRFLAERNYLERSYFHISDEPQVEQIDAYQAASAIFTRNLAGCKFIDALSKPEFFQRQLVKIPVPAVNHLDDFARFDLPERWTYYCVGQWDKVPNQFAHFPSLRNRVMGLLAYLYQLDGFLHWGYNFWFAQLSSFRCDPYREICAGHAFPPGDAFKVYPGKDGCPEDSIRHEVFFEAVQDLTALQALEALEGREKVLRLIEEFFGYLPDMTHYPLDNRRFLEFRELVNGHLAQDRTLYM